MPQVANIVIKDGQATPVDHTFKPTRQSGDMFVFSDQSSDVAAGFKTISVMTRFESNGNAGRKITMKVIDPTLAVTAPASGTGVQPNPVSAYQTMATIEFLLPQAAKIANRKDLLAYVKNLVSHAFVASMVEDLDAPR